jgi:beta-galactosidase/beta-glucuronidase
LVSQKRDVIVVIDELMSTGHQVAVPVSPEGMDEVRRNVKKYLNEKKKHPIDEQIPFEKN